MQNDTSRLYGAIFNSLLQKKVGALRYKVSGPKVNVITNSWYI